MSIWKECYRILKKGGILLAGLDNGMNFVFDTDEKTVRFKLPFDPLHNEEHKAMLDENGDGMQFSHTIDEQIGGQLAAGFRLTNVFGDTNGSGILHEHNIHTFWATRAIKE